MTGSVTQVLCSLDDLVEGDVRRFDVDQRSIAVVRIGADVYALGDRCSHQDVSLSEGDVDADEMTLECPKHGATFCLETGDALTLPATRPVPIYSVTVVDGEVAVVID